MLCEYPLVHIDLNMFVDKVTNSFQNNCMHYFLQPVYNFLLVLTATFFYVQKFLGGYVALQTRLHCLGPIHIE